MTHDTLTTLNERLHVVLDGALLDVLDRLTALQIDAARARFTALDAALAAHMEVEDGPVMTAFAACGPFPRGGSPELVDADHRSLDKVLGAARRALALLPDPVDRRTMVLALPLFFRIRGVLEHHTLREQRFVYPTLDARLPADEIARLADALRGTVGPPLLADDLDAEGP